MTNEKAIERIKAFSIFLTGGNPIWDVDECREAFEIALAAMEQKWIPVSEKPNKCERYIVTAKLMGGFMDGYTSIEIARWNGYYWEIEDVMSDYKVTAYMPLPEPWEGEEG